MTPKRLVLALAGWSLALSAAAQWQWVGKDGRKVFSDRPPPAEVQEKDIVKQPGVRGSVPVVTLPPEGSENTRPTTAEPAPAARTKVGPHAPKISGMDADLQATKKKLGDEDAARKKVEDDKLTQTRADNCERAKRAVVTLQSGVRMSTTNADGERAIMDDAARAAEATRLRGMVDSNCK